MTDPTRSSPDAAASQRPPGPWDPRPDTVGDAPSPAARTGGSSAAAPGPIIGRPSNAEIFRPQVNLGALLGGSAVLFAIVWFVTQSWVLGAAIVWGVLVHEYGHVLAMNRLGMGPASLHVTFFGGFAQPRRGPDSEWHGVLVALAGPLFGLLAAIPFFGLYIATGGGVWLLAAAVIGALNLVNLAPAPPLDGSKAIGPVLARIHPMVERVALIAVGAAVVWWGVVTGRWILAAFLLIALIGYLKQGAWRPPARDLTVRETAMSVGAFFGTAAACAAVAVAAMTAMAGGSVAGGLSMAGRYLGLGG